MPMFELDFKIRHACTLGNISWDFPSIRILKWTNNGREVMELAGVASSDGVKIVRRISEAAEVMEKMSDGQKIHLITAACSCVVEEILEKGVGETSLLSISPTVFRKGWEYYRVIALRQDGINMLMDKLKEKSFFPVILRKIPFNGFSGGSMTFTADSLFSELTEKQMNAILTAYRHGYYKLPRDTDLQTIAAKTQIARTTLQEHLKKAENKIVGSLAPHIHAWFHLRSGNQTQIVE